MRSSKHLLSFLFSCLVVAGNVYGQAQHQSGERGFNAGKSYAISDIETIGLYSGNVMFNVPLGSLPPGRGGMSAVLSLNYNSKVWDTFATDVIRFTTTHDMTTLAPSPEGGWHYSYAYYLKLDYRNLGSLTGACQSGVEDSFTIIKIQLVTPDGAQHLMLPTSTGTIGTYEFSNVYPDGRLLCDPVAVTSAQLVTFYSKDSSFLRLEVLTDSDTDWMNNPWTLYMADGTKVTQNPSTSTQQITDRNGNYVQIVQNATDASYSNHRTTYIKDQFDRKVVIEYEADDDEDRIHSKGFDGETITTRVTWKDILVNKTYFACEMAPSPLDQDAFENYELSESFRVVDRVYLPTQIDGDQFYEFDYNADNTSSADTGWGEVSQVTMPSGAVSAYEYQYDSISGSTVSADEILLNRPVEKNLTYDLEYDLSSSPTTDTWTYTRTGTTVTMAGPDGASTTEHYGLNADNPGEVYKTVAANGTVVEKLWATNSPISAFATDVKTNRFVRYEFTSIANSSGSPTKTAIREYVQDKNGNTTEVKEYDFVSYSSVPRDGNGNVTGLPTSGLTLKRITKTAFYNPTPTWDSTTYDDADSYHLASSERLLRLPSSIEVQDGSATPKSRSEMTYDYTNYDSSNTKGGNVTLTKAWDSFKGGASRAYSNPLTSTNSIETSAIYNAYGMPTSATDANGNITAITYGNITCPGGTVTDLYPTLTVVADGTAIERTSSAVYDCYTGLVTTATDEDNDVSVVTEYDDLGRPLKVRNAYGTALESWVQMEYHDADRYVVTKADLETVGDAKKVAIQHFDQLGRVRLSRTLENAATESASNEAHGIKIQTRYATTYSSPNGYTYQLTSNPYRAATSSAASSEPTMGWTRSKDHHQGRHSEVESFSGSALPAPWGTNTSSTGVVQTDKDVDATTVTDQAGKLHRSITNGLGQLVRIDEPDNSSSTGSLGTVASPTQATSYGFDTLNNLTTVTQGTQTRTFTYSSLSRLLSATNPESGTIAYEYANNGNLTEKTDARGIVTSYVYDALNRVTERNYTNEPSGSETPDVDYTYGTTAPKVGKLTKVESSVSTTEFTSFDILGRVTASNQTTDGVTYGNGTTDSTMTYTYNLAGAMIEQQYPSGRKVKNVLDNSGDLSLVQSRKNTSSGYWNYASSFTYNSAGAVTTMQLGNGRWESTSFNSRLQPTQIALGSTPAATNLLALDFGYGTTTNNGNVMSQTINFTGLTHPFVQSFSYDSLNRIDDSSETYNSSQTWRQDFSYDRYGNRNFVEANTTTLPKNCGTSPNFTVCTADKKVFNPAIDPANNQLDTDDDYAYDDSGNTTTDAQGRQFIYDAESKQVKVLDDQDDVIGEYWYDGDGRRVRKHVPSTGEVTVFVYDASGKLIAEYSTIVETTNAKVGYVTNDHLASPRINTDENGAVTSRHDYHPFGEEIAASERTTGLGYVEDTVRKQFTGYERDDETELDFAKARYFASSHGRFSSPDDFLNDTDNIDPQSWNLYVYVRNNPLRYVDPDGKIKRDKDGNIIKEDREDKDEYTTVINGKTYYLSPYKSADGKKQVVWEVKKVTIFADNGDKIKAYETKGDLQVLQTSTDANGQATSNLLSVDDSKAMLGPDSASYDNKTNCHGTTFADGKVWIENDQVGAILKGDGYSQRRSGERADEGDVGLYTSTENGKSYVDHTVRVDFVDDKSGAVIDVTSKGGITPKQTRAAPGPGPGTAWPNSTSQVHYFTQRMKK